MSDETLAVALDTIDSLVPEMEWKTRAMARGLMRGYDARWSDQAERMIVCEEEFVVPIWNLANKGIKPSQSRTLKFAGKRDKRVLRNSSRWILDHKTTSVDIQDPDATYWRQLAINAQASWYLLAGHYEDLGVEGIIWDVIRKPAIKPKKIAQTMQKSVVAGNPYCGFDVSDNAQAYIVENGTENAELFELRVTRETINDPDRYYQRKPIMRLLHDMVDDCQELWQLAQDVLYSRRCNWQPCNSNACLTYGSPCQYLGICSGHDTIDSDNWRRREQVHSELDSIEGDGKNIITTSRLACFQNCRRKHHYRYDLGLERHDREPSAALQFGTTFHAALDVWWKAYKL